MATTKLVDRLEPNYSQLDLSWNFQPATQRQSYRFVLFNSKSGSDTFLRERYIYEKDQTKETKTGDERHEGSEKFSLLKVPIKQLLINIEERRREKERSAEEAKLKGSRMDIEFISSSRGDGSVEVKRKRITEAYLPKDFTDLIGSDKTNRFALKWLKSWDFKVFKKKLPSKPTVTPDKTDLNVFNNSNKRKTLKFPSDLQNQFENLSLTEEKDILELNSKMLLLSGNSGTGKTTLASVIAKKCGYNPFKVEIYCNPRYLSLTKQTWTTSLIRSRISLKEKASWRPAKAQVCSFWMISTISFPPITE